MTDTRLADISEFQPDIDARAYLGGGYGCLIVRAHNGHRPDDRWPGRRDYLRAYPFACLGWYQYLVSSRDAREQARDFIACVGPLRANEFVILDVEEGAGSQVHRAEAWFGVVDRHYGRASTLYAGLSFGRDHLGGWDYWRSRPRWIAAYQSAEPRDAHELWQNTDRARFPGLAGGVDGNIFHGAYERFCAVFAPGSTSPGLSPPRAADALLDASSSVCVLKRDGGRELFVERASGQIWHAWDTAGGPWSAWSSLGTPGR